MSPTPVARRQGAPTPRSVIVVSFDQTPYAVTAADDYLLVDATDGVVVITLPAVATLQKAYRQRELVIKKIDASANVVTVTAIVPDLIDGAATHDLTAPYESVRITNDLTADLAGWWVIGSVS